MTPEQKDIFIRAAGLGVACGLNHRFEWFTNALRATQHGPYDEASQRRSELEEAFVAFERTTAGSEHEDLELQRMNIGDYYIRVERFYMKGHGL